MKKNIKPIFLMMFAIAAAIAIGVVACSKDDNSSSGSSSGNGGSGGISAPTGLTAQSVGTESSPQVRLSWNTVPGAAYYMVYYSNHDGDYTYWTEVEENYVTDNYPYTGANYYKVRAVDYDDNMSGYSNAAYVYVSSGSPTPRPTPTPSEQTPSAPTGVSASNVGSSSSPQIKVSWSSVSNATSYKVYRSSSASGSYSQIGSSTTSTYLYDYSPLSGYNYYKVKAVNSAGESSYSSYASYNNTNSGGGSGGGSTTYSPCPPTVNVSGSSSLSVSWTVSSSTGCGSPTSYEVYKYDPCEGQYNLKTTTTSRSYSCSSSDVHPGINRFAIKAINSAGNATGYGYSSEVSLSKPSSFSAQKQNNGYVKFTWSKVPKATGYQIFYSTTTSSGNYYILQQVDDVNTTTETVYCPGTSGSTYYFKIKAFYSCGTSPVYSDLTTYKSVTF